MMCELYIIKNWEGGSYYYVDAQSVRDALEKQRDYIMKKYNLKASDFDFEEEEGRLWMIGHYGGHWYAEPAKKRG